MSVDVIVRLAVAFFAGALATVPAGAAHLSYEFAVDRFEVVGASGTSADDFDDGVLDPWATGIFGTTVEEGGVVRFSDPGLTDLSLMPGLPILAERSDIFTSEFVVANGAGDFDAISRWVSGAPGTNERFSMDITFRTDDEALFVGVGVSVAQLSAELAATIGLSEGLYLVQNKTTQVAEAGFGGVPQPGDILALDLQTFAIAPGDVTGAILLRLSFDDSADTFVASVSLNGGTSFLAPFTPVSSELGSSNWGWGLGAEEFEVVPEPTTGLLLCSGLVAISSWRRRFFRPWSALSAPRA